MPRAGFRRVTVLQALDGYYGRMAARGDAEAPGYSREKISFVILLSRDGEPVRVRDLREQSGKKTVPQLLEVPASVTRASGIKPNFLWDKTAYVLGRTAGEGKRTAEEHAQFKAENLTALSETQDPGLIAFSRFLVSWLPARFDAAPFEPNMLDCNIIFALDGDHVYLHQRQAARHLVAARDGGTAATAPCLVTGTNGPVARLHPRVKGVEGAQSSGASLVSFNLDAFTSYGKDQGDNAPTSQAAAFRYGAALNRMLDRGSRNRLAGRLGDSTVVYWADTSDTVSDAEASQAELLFSWLVTPPDDDTERAKLSDALGKLAQGRPVADAMAGVVPGTRFHVLGLAPNAARLSVRYWLSDSFDSFAARLSAHYADLRLEPPAWKKEPALRTLLLKTTALQEKSENVPPVLAGEVMRAVLTGGAYPRSWLAATIARLRAGDDPSTGWHAAVLRGILARQLRLKYHDLPDYDPTKDVPMSLNRQSTDPAYTCGRLFATLESAQRSALGGKVNATIRDRYMGAASATPASIFPLLLRNAQNHLGKLRKDGKGQWLERDLEEIQDRIEGDRFPKSLKLEQQGKFFLGYYHQRKAQFTKAKEIGESLEQNHEGDNDGE
jgi:CRISPR-associated protein Csd1